MLGAFEVGFFFRRKLAEVKRKKKRGGEEKREKGKLSSLLSLLEFEGKIIFFCVLKRGVETEKRGKDHLRIPFMFLFGLF